MLKAASRTVSAIIAAGLVAGAITILPGASDKVAASSPLNSGKGDRLDLRPVDAKCTEQAWPYYDASGLKDRRQAMGQAKAVRVVTADRKAPVEASATQRAVK
jgi:hypothetical protein